MSAAERYRADSQQRLLQAIEALAEHPLAAVGAANLAQRIGCTRDQAFRALRNLELAGWAVEAPGFTFRLAARATRLSEGVRAAFAAELRAYLGDGS